MTKQAGFTLTALVALTLLGCSRRDEASPLAAREPLAKAAPVLAAPPPAAPKPAPTALEAKSEKPLAAVEPAKKLVKSTPEPTLSSGQGLAVRRLVVSRSIERREPVLADRLTVSDEPLYAFVELENDSDQADGVVITFEHEGKSVGHVKLEVPAKNKRWRTWGKTKQVRQAGDWVVVVKSADGKELARKSFRVE